MLGEENHGHCQRARLSARTRQPERQQMVARRAQPFDAGWRLQVREHVGLDTAGQHPVEIVDRPLGRLQQLR